MTRSYLFYDSKLGVVARRNSPRMCAILFHTFFHDSEIVDERTAAAAKVAVLLCRLWDVTRSYARCGACICVILCVQICGVARAHGRGKSLK